MSSAVETDEESSMDLDLGFALHLGNERITSSKKPGFPTLKGSKSQQKMDLELSLSTGPSESDITSINRSSTALEFSVEMLPGFGGTSADEEFTGIAVLPSETSQKPASFLCNQVSRGNEASTSTGPDLSTSVVTTPESSVTCTSGVTQLPQTHEHSSSSKTCQVEGCLKGARGPSGCCISHGGGRRCQKPGCPKGAEGRTVYCKAHGGGRRCEFLGCTKSAEGRTDFCIAHGGGRRCSHEGCTRAARGKSGLCIRHGGGKRCQKENCTKSAEGLSGLCISHGGGRRCQSLGCTKGAQGSTMFCKAHGGGKRCTAPGCTKGAEGSTPFCKGHGGGKRCAFQGGGVCTKSVYGGTNFCVAHGGGKRCAVPECTKGARGRTDFCVRHGGGKRCKFEGCGKSTQGSTDFCKAHGGGKRCSWGHPGSEYGVQPTGPCNSFARGKTDLCALHSGLVQDKRVHFCKGIPLYFEPLPCQEVRSIESDESKEMSIDSKERQTIFGQQYYEISNWFELLLSDFPSIFGVKQAPKSLQEQICPIYLIRLNLQNIEINTPWKGKQPLVNLKSINFSYSKLSRLPDLSHAPKLERLNVQYCTNIIEASSFESLSNLEYINLKGCINLESLPSMLELKSLDILIVTGCSRLGKLPELSRSTKRLLLSGIGIEELPAAVGLLTGLVELDLSNCERLKKLSSGIFNLASLVTLNVSGCIGLMKTTMRNRK